jgi:hypothetical protein
MPRVLQALRLGLRGFSAGIFIGKSLITVAAATAAGAVLYILFCRRCG